MDKGKSLIKIVKNKGLRTNPYGIPLNTSDQDEKYHLH